MMDWEVQQHLKGCLFHGVCKTYSRFHQVSLQHPRTSYLQLEVASQKAESENEEIQDKVRARAAVATDSRDETTELGQQIV